MDSPVHDALADAKMMAALYRRLAMKAVVVKLNRETHPNAQRMFVQTIPGGIVCGSITAWKGKEFAVHIPPGAIVDTDRAEFAWLKDPKLFNPALDGDLRYHRAKAVDLRGVLSQGFMTDVPSGAVEGQDVSALLGVIFD